MRLSLRVIKLVDKNGAAKGFVSQGGQPHLMTAFIALLLQNKDGDSDDISG